MSQRSCLADDAAKTINDVLGDVPTKEGEG